MPFDTDPTLNALLEKLVHPQLKVIDPSLHRMEALMAALGNPQHQLPPVIHVAGTNGKGSLIAYLKAMLEAAGLRVHVYTSPHLVEFRERIVVAGEKISNAPLVPLLQEVLALQNTHPATFFEATTAAAFLAFARNAADVVLLETGMGGRLDATNILPDPAVVAITPIGKDHAEFLGETLAEIAGEKAGIIKQGRPIVIGQQSPEALAVLERVAAERAAPLSRFGQEWSAKRSRDGWNYKGRQHYDALPLPALLGEHQIANAATAIAVLEAFFDLERGIIDEGLKNVLWPARMQKLENTYWNTLLPADATLYLDGGHNPHAAAVIAEWARAQKKPLTLIIGMLANKDLQGFLRCWQGVVTHIIAVPIPNEPNAHPPEAIAQQAQSLGFEASAAESIEAALQNTATKTVLICGSLYLAGAVLRQ